MSSELFGTLAAFIVYCVTWLVIDSWFVVVVVVVLCPYYGSEIEVLRLEYKAFSDTSV
jgi:hypothetical protein